jgi:hypothetical protein
MAKKKYNALEEGFDIEASFASWRKRRLHHLTLKLIAKCFTNARYGSKVLTAVLLNVQVFWQCRLVKLPTFRRFLLPLYFGLISPLILERQTPKFNELKVDAA